MAAMRPDDDGDEKTLSSPVYKPAVAPAAGDFDDDNPIAKTVTSAPAFKRVPDRAPVAAPVASPSRSMVPLVVAAVLLITGGAISAWVLTTPGRPAAAPLAAPAPTPAPAPTLESRVTALDRRLSGVPDSSVVLQARTSLASLKSKLATAGDDAQARDEVSAGLAALEQSKDF
jgi:hypothetical protein